MLVRRNERGVHTLAPCEDGVIAMELALHLVDFLLHFRVEPVVVLGLVVMILRILRR